LENELKRQGFLWEKFLLEVPVNRQQSDILRLRTAVVEMLPGIIAAESQRRRYLQHDATLLELQRNLDQGTPTSEKAEVIYSLRDAIQRRDTAAYRAAFESLIELHARSETLRLRRSLLERIERVAPGWASTIRARNGIHGEGKLPGNPEEAWLWRQLYEELDQRAKVSLEELQEKILQLKAELFQITAELVENRAWIAQIRRTTIEQQRALQGWREFMRKVGKGKGKRAPRLLSEARKLMPVCQSAVPVWIMPLSHVAKNFDMKRNRFDVVIIDEASQADMT